MAYGELPFQPDHEELATDRQVTAQNVSGWELSHNGLQTLPDFNPDDAKPTEQLVSELEKQANRIVGFADDDYENASFHYREVTSNGRETIQRAYFRTAQHPTYGNLLRLVVNDEIDEPGGSQRLDIQEFLYSSHAGLIVCKSTQAARYSLFDEWEYMQGGGPILSIRQPYTAEDQPRLHIRTGEGYRISTSEAAAYPSEQRELISKLTWLLRGFTREGTLRPDIQMPRRTSQ